MAILEAATMKWLSLDIRGGFGGPGVDPSWMGTPLRYGTLLWCVETGFVPFEGRMLNGW